MGRRQTDVLHIWTIPSSIVVVVYCRISLYPHAPEYIDVIDADEKEIEFDRLDVKK